MVADVLAVVDLGSTDANFVTQAEQFAHARNARLTVAVAAPVKLSFGRKKHGMLVPA